MQVSLRNVSERVEGRRLCWHVVKDERQTDEAVSASFLQDGQPKSKREHP